VQKSPSAGKKQFDQKQQQSKNSLHKQQSFEYTQRPNSTRALPQEQGKMFSFRTSGATEATALKTGGGKNPFE